MRMDTYERTAVVLCEYSQHVIYIPREVGGGPGRVPR